MGSTLSPGTSIQSLFGSAPADHTRKPRKESPAEVEVTRVLFIDAYDSFSYNVVNLLRDTLITTHPGKEPQICIIKIDDERFNGQRNRKAFLRFLQDFDAVVLGPGPGNPSNQHDVGLFNTLWTLADAEMLPIFGVCLGFQSMCIAVGARIKRLKEPRHGIPTFISHCSDSIFSGVEKIRATQYHSLHVDISHPLQDQSMLDALARAGPWLSSPACALIQPLAWDFSDLENGPVLMAAKVRDKPFWGVQFHPESIAADRACFKILLNFLEEVRVRARGFTADPAMSENLTNGHDGKDAEILTKGVESREQVRRDPSIPRLDTHASHGNESHINGSPPAPQIVNGEPLHEPHVGHMPTQYGGFDFERSVTYKTCELKQQFWSDPVKELHDCGLIPLGTNITILESGTRQNGTLANDLTGQQTIIGFPDEDDEHGGVSIRYHVQDRRLCVLNTGRETYHQSDVDFWDYYKNMMKMFKCSNGHEESRFWGGCVHVVSYEAGLETIGVNPAPQGYTSSNSPSNHPDILVSVVRRSIVLNHLSRKCYVQSIKPNDRSWVETTAQQMSKPGSINNRTNGHPMNGFVSGETSQRKSDSTAQLIAETLSVDSRQMYESKVQQCQEYIRAGDSYQLCLTDQTDITVQVPKSTQSASWNLFRNLMRNNPAPFGAFIRLGACGEGLTLVSSSPERFFRWNRLGDCEFRPMKGTYQKKAGETIEDARRALSTTKEQAENLMITDLIRNDMHKILHRVEVPKLMHVEEYATVFQMVSVITGSLQQSGATGLDILRASLPPGSMTGTPKKRSCELLQKIEEYRPRGVYSGIVGYVDAGGNGDNAVIIRSAFKWDTENVVVERHDEQSPCVQETWHIGAGGAVTAKSTPRGEHDEVVIKRAPLIRAFFSSASSHDNLSFVEKSVERSEERRVSLTLDSTKP